MGRKKLIKCDIYQIGTQHGGQTCKLQQEGGRGIQSLKTCCLLHVWQISAASSIKLIFFCSELTTLKQRTVFNICNSLEFFFPYFLGVFSGLDLRLDKSLCCGPALRKYERLHNFACIALGSRGFAGHVAPGTRFAFLIRQATGFQTGAYTKNY